MLSVTLGCHLGVDARDFLRLLLTWPPALFILEKKESGTKRNP